MSPARPNVARVGSKGVWPMTEPAEDADRLLAAARAGSREALGRVLEAHRRYLLVVAEHELGPDLRSKGGASDMVQETFLEAQRDIARFQGSSPEEFRAWLRQVLVHNVGAFTRRFRATSKRDVGLEVDFQANGSGAAVDQELAGSSLPPNGVAIEHEQ